MKATDIRVETVHVSFADERLSVPLHLSRGSIEAITYAMVSLQVRTRAGTVAHGVGTILLSDLWAFPAADLSHTEKDHLMRQLCRGIAARLQNDDYGDPMEKGMALEQVASELAHQVSATEPLPPLAMLNCLAPFDAALHDAWGNALPVPLYAGYTSRWLNQDLGAYLGADFAGRYPGDYLAPARRVLSVQHVVGISDALTPAQVASDQPPPAELPADLASWIKRDRVRYFKLKVSGQAPATDAQRLVEVYTVVSLTLAQIGVADGPRLSVDPNEGYHDPEALLEMLERVEADNLHVLAALDYIEQPTPRDLRSYTDTLHDVARRVPVIIDESLDRLDHLEHLHALGWSGLAVKTCKGHTHSLLAYCWARHHGLYLTMQDLTNPGLALVHSANLCAHLQLDVDCFECNQHQFLPLARPDDKVAYPNYFQVTEGQLVLPATMGPGLY